MDALPPARSRSAAVTFLSVPRRPVRCRNLGDIINALNVRNLQGRELDYNRLRTSGMLYLKDTVGAGLFPALTFRITF